MSLPPRKIGNGLVNPIGFGAMGISAFYGQGSTDEEAFAVFDRMLELGCNHLDTSSIYNDNEEVIGRWLKHTGNRSKIFLATKFGFADDYSIHGEPEFVHASFERSSKRLGVDQIDLFYQHRPDPKTPIEITVGAMAELVKAGKVKYLGLSEVTAQDIRRAHAVHPISAVQIEYNPFFLDIEDEKIGILKVARELGITVVAYSPLARGMVTGRYKSPDDLAPDDMRHQIPKYSKENYPKILDVVSKIHEVGKKHNATPAQVTLAWILAQGDEFVVIPGTRSIKYLEENMGGGKVRLSDEEVATVRKIAKAADLVGERYGDALISTVLVSTPELPK